MGTFTKNNLSENLLQLTMFVDRMLWAKQSITVGLQNPCSKRKKNIKTFFNLHCFKNYQNICLKNNIDSFYCWWRQQKEQPVRCLSEVSEEGVVQASSQLWHQSFGDRRGADTAWWQNSSPDPLGEVSRADRPICQSSTGTSVELRMIFLGCSFLWCPKFRCEDFPKLDVCPAQLWQEGNSVL